MIRVSESSPAAQPSYYDNPPKDIPSPPPLALLSVANAMARSPRQGYHLRKKASKRVHFAANPVSRAAWVDIEEDKDLCWYTHDDLVSFKQERKIIVQALRDCGGKIPAAAADAELCIRGFEDYVTNETTIAKKQNIKNAAQAVLSEQERQRSVGTRDDTKLALVSMQTTFMTKKKAENFGLSDAHEAFRLYAEYVEMIKSKTVRNAVARTA